jgi:tetratricopeptide (TPR) repeat protein
MTRHRRMAWLLVSLLAGPGMASAARMGRLIGRAVDPEGKPIPGVSVTTTCADIADFREVTTTNDKGIFMVDFGKINVTYRYVLVKTGYVPLTVEQNWTFEGTERHDFKMLAAPAAKSEGGPAAPAAAAAPAPAPAPTSIEAVRAFNAGVLAFKAKDYPTATAKFEEALSYDPRLGRAWAVLSQINLEQKRYQEAADAAEKAVALGAADPSVLQSRWEAYRKLGDDAKTAKAREDLERIGRMTEEAKRVHNEAVALLKAGDDAGAFAKFQEALTLDPNLQPALLGVATTGLKLGHAAEAAAAAATILKTDPQNEGAIRVRYNAALKLGDKGMALESLEALAASSAVDRSTVVDGLSKLAFAAFESDDIPHAKEALGKALELDPDHARSHYLQGLILMREGAMEEARSHLERFLALAPNDPDAATARNALKYVK